VTVVVFVPTGTAAGLEHFVANHGHHGVIGGALASGTMVVNVVAEAHELSWTPLSNP
jgi:hypothetical protein